MKIHQDLFFDLQELKEVYVGEVFMWNNSFYMKCFNRPMHEYYFIDLTTGEFDYDIVPTNQVRVVKDACLSIGAIDVK